MEPKLPGDCEYHLTQLFQTPELRTEIRAYLRHRLFTSIQNSSLGPSLSRKDVQPVSPKLQTLNLLVAEYLLRHRHHFTLSVFSCEVPSVSCLSPSLQDTLRGRSTSSSVPFCEEDLNDMMETLGILPTCFEGQELLVRYSKREQPLLECLIRALPQLRNPVVAPVQRRDQSSNTEQMPTVSSNIESNVKQSYLDAISELKMIHEKKINDERDKWSSQLLEKEQESHQLNYRHTVEEQKLRELITSLQDQLRQAQIAVSEIRAEKITDTQKVESEKRKLETTQETMEQKLQLRQIKLSEESHRLEREKLGLKKVKKKLQLKQRQLDEVALALTHSQAEQPDQSVIPALEIQLQIKEQEVSEQKAEAQRLREENQMLKSMCEQQRHRIDNMNVRMAELVSELHHTRENLAEMSSVPKWPSHNSSHHSRRHYSSSSSDGSPTEEVIRDAKRRIKILEDEFEQISHQHMDYQQRHLTETILAASSGTSSAFYYAAKHNTPGAGWKADQSISFQQSTPHSTQPPAIPKLPTNQNSRERTFTVPQETPKHGVENPKVNDNSPYKLPSNEYRMQDLRENRPQLSEQANLSHSSSYETNNASRYVISNTTGVGFIPNEKHLDVFAKVVNAIVQGRKDPPLASANNNFSERLAAPIGPMGDSIITRDDPSTSYRHVAFENNNFSERIAAPLEPVGETVIKRDEPSTSVIPLSSSDHLIFNEKIMAATVGPHGDNTISRDEPASSFIPPLLSANNVISNERIVVEPLGSLENTSVTREEPEAATKSIPPTLNILQTENINIYTSEILDSSISINGHSHSEASFASKGEKSHHSLLEEHVNQQKSEVSQPINLQLKSDYKLKDPQVSSSSSSKHISAGIVSPKPEEDDFWDM